MSDALDLLEPYDICGAYPLLVFNDVGSKGKGYAVAENFNAFS